MTDLLDIAEAAARSLSPEKQDRVARMVLALIAMEPEQRRAAMDTVDRIARGEGGAGDRQELLAAVFEQHASGSP